MNKQDKNFLDLQENYFLLYEKAVEENEKLRERINYPKVEITSYLVPFGKEQFIAKFPLGDFSIFHVIQEFDAIICERDKTYRETIINHLLRELGYRYFKRAYDYWQIEEQKKDEVKE